VRGEVAVADGGADAQPAAGQLLDVVVRQSGDVDEDVRALDAELHEVDEVRPAAEVAGARSGRVEERERAGGVPGALVGERLHPAASEMAGTMFVYAPQRHRLPLMRSRISASSSAGSPARPAVT
jgi:hypothetical protein